MKKLRYKVTYLVDLGLICSPSNSRARVLTAILHCLAIVRLFNLQGQMKALWPYIKMWVESRLKVLNLRSGEVTVANVTESEGLGSKFSLSQTHISNIALQN